MLIRTAAATIAVAAAAQAQTVHDVLVGPNGLFVFDPANIEVDLGDTVRWTWQSDFHNVVSGLPDGAQIVASLIKGLTQGRLARITEDAP